jgi:SNF2 family DNA or RNA helicase
MAEIYHPEPYQEYGTKHLIEHPFAGLLMEMGLGKTVVTLTAYIELKKRGLVRNAIVIAPLKVARDTWPQEIAKWEHTKHLKVSVAIGNAAQRLEALRKPADIYTINCDNAKWLVAQFPNWKFDWLIVDELSKFKSAKSNRFKALRTARPKMRRVSGLTGTPRSNGLHDLWSQLYLLDQGERLGKTLTEYRQKFFEPDKQKGHVVYSYKLKKEKDPLIGDEIYAEVIYDKIGDICVSMRA